MRRENFREQKENLTWWVNTICLLEPLSLSLFSQLVSLSFSQSYESKAESVKWIVSPRGNVFLIFYSRCFLPSLFFITVWFEPPPPRSCGWSTHIARSYSNAESTQRRARELQERKRNVRKFARLPFGMMNESLYSFCSQISFWLLKEKRCAKFNATNVMTKPPSSGLRFRAYTSAVVADFRHKIFIVAVWFK